MPIYVFRRRSPVANHTSDANLVEARNVSQARDILVGHLYHEPQVATPAELIQLTKAGVEVVTGRESADAEK